MQTDLISRSRVLDTLEAEKARLMGGKGCDWPFTGEILAKAVDTVIDFIKQVPAIDAVPVVHARLIAERERMGHYSHCSKCECRCQGYAPNYKYCPNCGAKMNAKEDE